MGGLTVALVGMIGDLLADNLMSFRTVAPISVSMIVWNAVFARALLGERMTRHLAGGTGLVLTGVAMTTLCVSDDNHLPLSTKEVHRSYFSVNNLFYCAAVTSFVLLNHLALHCLRRKRAAALAHWGMARVAMGGMLCRAAVAGTIGGHTNVLFKSTVYLFRDALGGADAFARGETYCIISALAVACSSKYAR